MQQRPIVIPLADLRARSASRPPAYFEDVVSHGKVVGEALELAPPEHRKLVAKYQPEQPAPEWPIWVLVASLFRHDPDTGIGETIARELGGGKSESFKRHHELIFGVWEKPCSCAGQVARWNALYPYASPAPSSPTLTTT